MNQSTVADVMTRKVVAVREGAEFKEIVEAMRSAHVSALPVLDSENHVIGVVSEGDLLVKEAAVARQRKATRRHPAGADKAAEVLAFGLMTQPAVTIGRDATVSEAAAVMSSKRVRRLPVVDDWGRLIGIVSQIDLLSVYSRGDGDVRGDAAGRGPGGPRHQSSGPAWGPHGRGRHLRRSQRRGTSPSTARAAGTTG
jgi:CBS-domain-containing membrane protein